MPRDSRLSFGPENRTRRGLKFHEAFTNEARWVPRDTPVGGTVQDRFDVRTATSGERESGEEKSLLPRARDTDYEAGFERS